jgi:hypothetical protein
MINFTSKGEPMKRNYTLFLIVLFFLPSLACGSFTTDSVVGSGEIVTQDIDIENFDRVTLEGFGSVFITQGQTDELSVETDSNLISFLDIRVQGHELRLGVKRGYDIRPTKSVSFHLTVRELSAIELNGSGDFYVDSLQADHLAVSIQGSGNIDILRLAADDLSIDLNGSGNITIEKLDVSTVETSLQGSGDIQLEGKTETEMVKVGGSGNYVAGDLAALTVDISIPGSADVTVWASQALTVRVTGSGDIRYYGQPTITQRGSGSSNLISLGEK